MHALSIDAPRALDTSSYNHFYHSNYSSICQLKPCETEESIHCEVSGLSRLTTPSRNCRGAKSSTSRAPANAAAIPATPRPAPNLKHIKFVTWLKFRSHHTSPKNDSTHLQKQPFHGLSRLLSPRGSKMRRFWTSSGCSAKCRAKAAQQGHTLAAMASYINIEVTVALCNINSMLEPLWVPIDIVVYGIYGICTYVEVVVMWRFKLMEHRKSHGNGSHDGSWSWTKTRGTCAQEGSADVLPCSFWVGWTCVKWPFFKVSIEQQRGKQWKQRNMGWGLLVQSLIRKRASKAIYN